MLSLIGTLKIKYVDFTPAIKIAREEYLEDKYMTSIFKPNLADSNLIPCIFIFNYV